MMDAPHAAALLAPPPSTTGCEGCLASGSWWLHLRRCITCGHIGCCEVSPHHHAERHFELTGHRYVQSFEPQENWWWDYVEEREVDGGQLPEPTSHPEGQSVPGPSARVPANWESFIFDE